MVTHSDLPEQWTFFNKKKVVEETIQKTIKNKRKENV